MRMEWTEKENRWIWIVEAEKKCCLNSIPKMCEKIHELPHKLRLAKHWWCHREIHLEWSICLILQNDPIILSSSIHRPSSMRSFHDFIKNKINIIMSSKWMVCALHTNTHIRCKAEHGKWIRHALAPTLINLCHRYDFQIAGRHNM